MTQTREGAVLPYIRASRIDRLLALGTVDPYVRVAKIEMREVPEEEAS